VRNPQDVVIVGAGGFGREVLQTVRAINANDGSINFCGFVDNVEPDKKLLLGIDAKCLGNDDDFLLSPSAQNFVLAIGNGASRERIAPKYLASALNAPQILHPTALVGDDVQLGEGTVVSAFACLTTHIQVGDFVHIDRSANIGHDSLIGDFVTIHPGAIVSGSVDLARGVTVGAGSCIMPGVHVGQEVIIGAGAVVTKNIADGDRVAGVPARSLSTPN